MGEEPNSLCKYFCDSSCQNSIHITYLGQVSLNTRKFNDQQFLKHTHTFGVYLYKDTQHFSCCGHDSSFTILMYRTDADLLVSLFLESLWNLAKLGIGVSQYLLRLLVEAAKKENYILCEY